MGIVGTTLAIALCAGLLGAAWLIDKLSDGPFSRGGPTRAFILHLLLVFGAWTILLLLPGDTGGPLPFFLMIGEMLLTGLLPLSLARLLFEDRDSAVPRTFAQKSARVGVIGLGLMSSWYLNFLFAATDALLPVPGDYVEYCLAVFVFPTLAVTLGFVAFRDSAQHTN